MSGYRMSGYNYPSVICEYCSCTEYGEYPCEIITPNGYSSCEGVGCELALDAYNDDIDNEEQLTIEDAF